MLLGLRYSGIDFPSQVFGDAMLTIGLFLLLFSNMLLFVLYDYLITLTGRMHEYELNQTKDALTRQHFSILQETNDRYAGLLHDVNNYIQTVQAIRTQGDSQQLDHISASLMSEISEIRGQTFCTCPLVNAVLLEKQQAARQDGIDYRVFVEPYFPTPHMADKDLISLLCNLLDNALEAAVKCPDPYVDIKFFVNGTYQVFKISNPYAGEPSRDHDRFFTTKPDAQNHGYGIRRAEAIAEKYHGTLSCTPQGSTFTAIVLLPLESDPM